MKKNLTKLLSFILLILMSLTGCKGAFENGGNNNGNGQDGEPPAPVVSLALNNSEKESLYRTGYRDLDGNAMTDALTPLSAVSKQVEKSGQKFYSPIEYDNSIYVIDGKTLLKLNKESLAENKSVLIADINSDWPVYITAGDGKIFVTVDGGRIRAFDADSLTQLWISAVHVDKRGKAYKKIVPYAPIVYYEGHVYTNVIGSGDDVVEIFYCLATSDNDSFSGEEVKDYRWSDQTAKKSNAFLNGGSPVVAGKYVLYSRNEVIYSHSLTETQYNDDGSTIITDSFELQSLVIGITEFTNRLLFDAATDRLYANTEKGLHSIIFNSDGTFDDDSYIKIKAEGHTAMNLYDERLYFNNPDLPDDIKDTGGFTAVDAETLETIYTIPDIQSTGEAVHTVGYATKTNARTRFIYTWASSTKGKYILYRIEDFSDNKKAKFTILTEAPESKIIPKIMVGLDGTLYSFCDTALYSFGKGGDYTASRVDGMISMLTEGENLSYIDNQSLIRTRNRYTSLNEDERIKVTKTDDLKDLQAKMLKLNDGTEIVEKLIKNIAALPEKLSIVNKSQIFNLWKNYLRLLASEKRAVTNRDKLITALDQIHVIMKDNAYLNDLNRLITAIDGLPAVVTIADKDTVLALWEDYRALPQAGRLRVKNIAALRLAADRIQAILLPETDIEWSAFRGATNSKGVSDAKTPIRGEDIRLNWKNKAANGWADGGAGFPIEVGNYIFITSGEALLKLDKVSGVEVQQVRLGGSTGFFSTIAHGDGKIFVPLENGILQAFDAQTMDSLWITAAPTYALGDCLGSMQSLSPVLYNDGFAYMGVSTGNCNEGAYFCVSTADEDISMTNEIKPFTWCFTPEYRTELKKNGFYWSEGVIVGNCIAFAGEEGVIYTHALGNRKVGTLEKFGTYFIDSFELPQTTPGTPESVRSSIAYDESLGRVYLSTKAGTLFTVEIDKDGKINKSSLVKRFIGSDLTSSPVVFKGRVYMGGGGVGSRAPVSILDAQTLNIIYQIHVPTQSSISISTAYATAENDYKVYFYFVSYFEPDILYVATDWQGNTKAYYELLLYTPDKQFNSSSVMIGTDGSLYYKNDTGYLYSFGHTNNTFFATDVVNAIALLSDNLNTQAEKTAALRAGYRYDSLSEEEQQKVTNYEKLDRLLSKVSIKKE